MLEEAGAPQASCLAGRCFEGPVLSNILAGVQLQSAPRQGKETNGFPYLEKASVTASAPQVAVRALLAGLHQQWKGG